MKRILVIFTGGTISSSSNEGIIDINKDKKYELIKKYNAIDNSIIFETDEPYFILSENLSGGHILNLYLCVKQALMDDYDGIIVTHGTDTLQYSASALDILLGKINIPVMLVSSNHPIDDMHSNGFDNFCAAIEFIKHKAIGGVFIPYKNSGEGEDLKIHTAEKLLDYDCGSDKLRSMKFDRLITKKYLNTDKLIINDKSSVLRIKAYPGMVYPSLDGIKCVMIEPYHSGTVKTDDGEFFEFIKNAEKQDKAIVFTGVTDGSIYKSAEKLKTFNNIVFSAYAPDYTYVLCWILTDNGIAIKDYF